MRRMRAKLCVGLSAEASTDQGPAAVLFMRRGLPEHGHLPGLIEKTLGSPLSFWRG